MVWPKAATPASAVEPLTQAVQPETRSVTLESANVLTAHTPPHTEEA